MCILSNPFLLPPHLSISFLTLIHLALPTNSISIWDSALASMAPFARISPRLVAFKSCVLFASALAPRSSHHLRINYYTIFEPASISDCRTFCCLNVGDSDEFLCVLAPQHPRSETSSQIRIVIRLWNKRNSVYFISDGTLKRKLKPCSSNRDRGRDYLDLSCP